MEYHEALNAVLKNARVKVKNEIKEHIGKIFVISHLDGEGDKAIATLLYDGSKSTTPPPSNNRITLSLDYLELV